MISVKKFLSHPYTIFGLAVILGVVLLYALILNPEPAEIGQVIGAKTFVGKDGKIYVKYAYVGGKMDIAVSKNVEQTAKEKEVKIVAEDLSARTSSSRTFVTDKPEVRISEFTSGPNYFKDDQANWWQAEYAYTTPERFALLPKTPLYARMTDTSRFAFIKKAFATTDTFYPDAQPETTTVDGYIQRGAIGESFATIRAGAGTAVNDSNAAASVSLLAYNTNTYQQMRRAAFLFDTASIADTDQIDSATFSVNVTSRLDELGGGGIVLTSSNPTSNTVLATGDYAIAKWGSTAYAPTLLLSSMSNGSYNDWPLNSSGKSAISKTGITKFGLMTNWDFSNTDPLAATGGLDDAMFIATADTTGTASDPKLVVVHSVPPIPSTGSVFKQDVIFKQNVIFK